MQSYYGLPANTESLQTFKRQLPRRLGGIQRQGRHLRLDFWDVNVLAALRERVESLRTLCLAHQVADCAERLHAVSTALKAHLDALTLPSEAQLLALQTALDALLQTASAVHREAEDAPKPQGAPSPLPEGPTLWVTPPPAFIDRFAKAVAPPASAQAPAAPTAAATHPPASAAQPAPAPTALAAAPPAPTQAVATAWGNRQVFHLCAGHALDNEIDQRLQKAGFEVERLTTTQEFSEIIQGITPALVLVAPSFLGDLESIGEMVRKLRGRAGQRIALMALANANDVAVRLKAMRAGVDVFLTLPLSADEVLARVQETLAPEEADPFRVLIVEDDRAQALFAESILRKAGMETRVVADPLAALETLEAFDPELVLMDLYMPGCDGMELTALIREREDFVNLPIVFLSGEHDTDKRFDALSAGGDDYLEKPIRPKYLISAVTNRVRRARLLNRRVTHHHARDAISGLYERSYFLERLAQALVQDGGTHSGGLLFVIIDGAQAIRERIGLSAFDTLLGQVGTLLSGLISGHDMAARYGDTSFVMLVSNPGAQALVAFAEEIRTRFEKHVFEVGDKSLALAVSIGIAPLVHGWADATSIVNAAERACARARVNAAQKVQVFEDAPPAPTHESEQEALLAAINDAVRHDRFQLLFQPIATLNGGAEEQFQALLRLRGDRGRLYTAAEIVPVAEESGLIEAVDRWVLQRCLALLQERDRIDRPIRLFISQSIAAFDDADRISWLLPQVQSRQIAPDRVVIELRAADVQSYLHRAIEFCTAARHAGLRIGLSGFEASTANYQMLQHLAVDYLKLSAKYVGNQSHAHQRELKQLIEFAHSRAIYVIAPLVEQAQVAAELWTVGVDFIQGDFVQQATQDLDFDFVASGA